MVTFTRRAKGVMIQQLKEAALSTGITYERFRENVEGKKTDYAPLDLVIK